MRHLLDNPLEIIGLPRIADIHQMDGGPCTKMTVMVLIDLQVDMEYDLEAKKIQGLRMAGHLTFPSLGHRGEIVVWRLGIEVNI